jgi:hypothetical protein
LFLFGLGQMPAYILPRWPESAFCQYSSSSDTQPAIYPNHRSVRAISPLYTFPGNTRAAVGPNIGSSDTQPAIFSDHRSVRAISPLYTIPRYTRAAVGSNTGSDNAESALRAVTSDPVSGDPIATHYTKPNSSSCPNHHPSDSSYSSWHL